ncbi:hypothetical protein FLONG3_5346 [Fusarium longipes]|uniref:Uncharacterized protein n=1 Tax=Fusarium longipes TaxID=694270 RepID=A0A395SUY1_9HYPO|nr:hypothetical protein FLONG3_5346 [Fusarium longipes]
MRAFHPDQELIDTALGREPVHLAKASIENGLHQAEPTAVNNKLEQRQVDSNPLLGTLTITVAPDATCAFNNRGDPALICSYNRRCSWESGDMNVAFCGFQSLYTTCYDYTAMNDLSQCDGNCRSNTHNGFCTASFYPYCNLYDLGGGISTWQCNASPASYWAATTQELEDRNFNTMTLINGSPWQTPTPLSTPADIITSASDDTTIASSSSSATTSFTVRPDPHPVPSVGAIAGGVIGGLAIVALGILGVWYLCHRRSKRPQPYNGPAPYIQQI